MRIKGDTQKASSSWLTKAASEKVAKIKEFGSDVKRVAASKFEDKSAPTTIYKNLQTKAAKDRVAETSRKIGASLAGAATPNTDKKSNPVIEAAEDVAVETAAEGFASIVGKAAEAAIPIPYVDKAVGYATEKATSTATKYVGGKAFDGKLFADKALAA